MSLGPAPHRSAPGPSVGTARGYLGRPDFRRLLAVRISAQWADGVFQASLAGTVLFNPQRAATPADIAAAFAVLLLPFSVLGPFVGVLLDRWSRQRVLLVSNLLRCVLVVLVAALVWTGSTGLPLYVAALSVISVNRFVLSALSAALPHVVTREQLVSANAVTTTVGTMSVVLGGACGVSLGVLFAAGDAGYAEMAATSALGYAASALVSAGFARWHLGPDESEQRGRSSAAHVWAGLVAGARHIRGHPRASTALAAIGAHRFLFGLASVAILLLYRNYFVGSGLLRTGLAGLTQVLVAGAIGALVAAAVTPVVVRSIGKSRWIVTLLATAAVSQPILGAPYRMTTVLLAAAVIGFVGQGVKVCVDTIVQETIDDSFRGRVFSVYDTVFNVAFVGAAVLAAFTLPETGKSYLVLGLIGGGYALSAAGYALATSTRSG